MSRLEELYEMQKELLQKLEDIEAQIQEEIRKENADTFLKTLQESTEIRVEPYPDVPKYGAEGTWLSST